MSHAGRRAAARDANEPSIIRAFEDAKWQVQRHTAWDLDVLCPRCKEVLSVEVKVPKDGPGTRAGRLTDNQKKLIDGGWPLHVVYLVRDVISLIALHGVIKHDRTVVKRYRDIWGAGEASAR